MAYVIAEPCVATCDTACVKVCPVDCIHGPMKPEDIELIPAEERPTKLRALQLYIDPEACICCAACEGECPVEAIFDEDDLPPAWAHYKEINARFFQR
ncbi:ferredoxin [Polyangium sp. 15x6]|uniref:4Fe-4S dicluster domain-containing protein n=1 Tax=Polyangium sp. 15x6 TaxID=3042687 RepID=UPI00249ACB0E|nr:ferredoxin [Polyangium sp. 15x6]MDI3291873.1 ferredoxin [Polyangium sp. 15x6]